jgi:hypothetical protein
MESRIKDLYQYFLERKYVCELSKREGHETIEFKGHRVFITQNCDMIQINFVSQSNVSIAHFDMTTQQIYKSKFLRIKSTNAFIRAQCKLVNDLTLLFQENSIRFILEA